MGKVSKRRLILGIIAVAVGLMTMLSLCFPIARIDAFRLSESGFSLLDFASQNINLDKEFVVCMGVIALLILLLSISTIIFSALTIFFFSDKVARKTRNGLSIACISLVFVYMLWAIIMRSILHYRNSTLVYLGFIFVALLVAALITCDCIFKELSNRQAEPCTAEARSVETSRAIAESLKLYKELLDNGVITQEEFDTKKNEILK